ncbi:hypothetical protein HDU93_003278 [Gonapodya sp. JEL0774]|nr:hypothetical protein HDU93_003278 [Gonapodya sp. JEL0774]
MPALTIETLDIPEISLDNFEERKVQISRELDAACHGIGFFYLVDHGIPPELISETFLLGKSFFDEPLEDKEAFKLGPTNQGYTTLNGQVLDRKRKVPDAKEGYNILMFPDKKTFDHPHPLIFQRNKELVMKFSDAAMGVVHKLLRALALVIEVPEDYFVSQFGGKDGSHNGTLRVLHYPPVEEDEVDDELENGVIRCGAHSDFGTMTVLFTEPDGPLGLQVLSPLTNRWEWVPSKPGAILINISDITEFQTRGYFLSTLHRVAPAPGIDRGRRRYSIAYFTQPDQSTLIKPITTSKRLDKFQALEEIRLKNSGAKAARGDETTFVEDMVANWKKAGTENIGEAGITVKDWILSRVKGTYKFA